MPSTPSRCPHVVEEDVARLDERPVQVDAAVPALLPAAEEVVAERDAARRSGRPGAGRRSSPRAMPAATATLNVEPGGYWPCMARLFSGCFGSCISAAPLVAPDAAREDVRVERGLRHHHEDLAVARVERDDRAVGLAERALGDVLQVAVERQRERVARARRRPRRARARGGRARRPRPAAPPGSPRSIVVERLLEPRLADAGRRSGSRCRAAFSSSRWLTSPT